MSKTMERIARIVAPATIGAVVLSGCNKMPETTPSHAPVVDPSATQKLSIEQRYRNEAATMAGKIMLALSVADTYETSYYGAETTKTYCVSSLPTAMRPTAIGACINPVSGWGDVSVVGNTPTIRGGIDSIHFYFIGQKLTKKYDSNLAMVKDGIDIDTVRPIKLIGREGMVVTSSESNAIITVDGPYWMLEKFGADKISGGYISESPEAKLPTTKVITEGDATDVGICESFKRLEAQLLPT